MKVSFIVLLTAATSAFAAPLPQQGTSSIAQSIQNMIEGAVGYPAAFLSGNPKAVADATAKMTGGAGSFTSGFFNDLQKASTAGAGAAPLSPKLGSS